MRLRQYDEPPALITGPRLVPAADLQVKLEGAGKLGERFVGMVGGRDPYTIAISMRSSPGRVDQRASGSGM